MKTQVLWPLQRTQHVAATACRVVLAARRTLATQRALLMPSFMGFLVASLT